MSVRSCGPSWPRARWALASCWSACSTKPLAVDFERVTLAEQELIGTNFMVPQTDLAEAQRLLVTRAGRWDVLAPRVIPLADVVPFAFAGDRESAAAPVKVLVDPSAGSSRGLYEPRPTYPEEPNR